ncbi:MAG TPA: LysR substrate-binding domain-containing protein [Pseudonocardiaceae bacterium]
MTFTLRQGAHEEILDWIRTGRADVALTSPLGRGGWGLALRDDVPVRTVRVAEQEFVLTVPTGHRLAGRPPPRPTVRCGR